MTDEFSISRLIFILIGIIGGPHDEVSFETLAVQRDHFWRCLLGW